MAEIRVRSPESQLLKAIIMLTKHPECPKQSLHGQRPRACAPCLANEIQSCKPAVAHAMYLLAEDTKPPKASKRNRVALARRCTSAYCLGYAVDEVFKKLP